MTLLRALFGPNPMRVEVARFVRRTMDPTRKGLGLAVGILFIVGTLLIASLTTKYDVDIVVAQYLQLVLITIVAPAATYASIAGERERRTWDFILAAPVTPAQIVAGKFLAGVAAVIAVMGFCFLPAAASSSEAWPSGSWAAGPVRSTMDRLVLGEIAAFAWGAVLCAVAVLISARSRRSFVALGSVIGALTLFLGLAPLVLSLLEESGVFATFFRGFHPFVTPASLGASMPSSVFAPHPLVVAATHLAIAAVCLVWAERTLRFADNEVRFIPRKPHA